ncbi:BTAD domain-containing putative transcriptional regulator [Streptomyces cacaoi]|uniref:AfsR/SARP family transcriptional regulator n=1 Tax=Streptomyces cacaoi TaxID=1898 RepID=UPI003748832B
MAEPPCTGLRFSVLGPLSAAAPETTGMIALPLGPYKQRLLLGMLLCRTRTPVSLDLLTETLWDGEPPRTARKNIQVYVSALRRLLDSVGAGDRLVHQPGGYQLRVGEQELDSLRFQRLVRTARESARQGADAPASRMLREALALRRGPALHELHRSPALRSEAQLLDARHLQAYEDWAEAELRLGRPHEVAETVGELAEKHPERERLRAAQMNALFSQGRQTEALAVYESVRQLLAAEYGLPPSPALEALYRSMLSGGRGRSRGGPLAQTAIGPEPAAGRGLGTLLPPDLPDFTGRHQQLDSLIGQLTGGDNALCHTGASGAEAVDHGAGLPSAGSAPHGEDRPPAPDPADTTGAGRRLIVLSGPVGTGKTALAVHAAHRLARRFPDGRVLIAMRDAAGRPRPVESVLAELCELAGLTDAPGAAGTAGTTGAQDPGRCAAAWRTWLARRRVLLVLDGCADESRVRPLVPDSGASIVLVTARSPLAGLTSADRLELKAFDAADSLRLLGRIVGPARLDVGREAAERIVVAIGMLPLAVRVCGLKLAVRRNLSLEEYARRLADSAVALDELVAGDMDVRPRLACGWRDLSPADRSALRLLADLPEGPFTLARAAVGLAQGQHEARRRLESLLDAGVVLAPADEVTAHAALYELPRLVRLFVREQTVRELTSPPRATA